MATQEGISDTRPHEAIPALTDETTPCDVASPADRQVLENGSAGRQDCRPKTTLSSTRAAIAQSVVVGAVLLLTTCCGIDVGYSAVLLPQLKAENSTLPTDDELGSWIASVQAIASALGIVLSGLLMERWDRRRALILCSVSFTAGWIVLTFATNHATILTARLMAGFSSGLTIWLTQVMVDEISQPRISAVLTAMKFLCHSVGILLVYILGAVMEWNTVSGVITAFPLLSLVVFLLLPDSPVWLVMNSRIQVAERALWWLRGRGAGTQEKREMEKLTSQDGSRDHDSVTRNPGTTRTHQTCCQDVSKPHILKPLIIVSVFYLIQIISGTYLLIFYAVDIMTHAGTGDGLGLDRYLAAVVTATVRLLFAVVTCFLLRWIGRRPLLLTVGSLQAIAALSVSMFLYTKNAINITDYEFPACKPIIIASILAYVATNTCTYFAMPSTSMVELLPDKIRGYACVYVLAGANVGVFVTTKLFPWLCNLLGVHGVFALFGATSAIGTFFMYLLLPESFGMSPVQIDNYFRQPNTMWVGRNMRLPRAETEPKTEYHEMRDRS